MTNAEKFKEVFGFEVDEDVCVAKVNKCEKCLLDKYVDTDKRLDCSHGFWNAEYQGEPTIPLSVIEDINYQLEELINKPCVNQNMMAQNLAYRNVQKMIKKQLGEVTHEED